MKMFSSAPSNNLLIDTINDLIDDYKHVLILVRDGKAYLLKDHHKYLKPETQAQKINLGQIFNTENGTYYFYERMHIITAQASQEIIKTKNNDNARRSSKVSRGGNRAINAKNSSKPAAKRK